MIETDSKIQEILVRGKSSSYHHLVNKVILLIGNDAEALHSIAVKFAAYGGDIALASSQLSVDQAEKIGEHVRCFGGRFIFLDKNLTNDIQKAETIINRVKNDLGKMDILVDLSAHCNRNPKSEAISDNSQPRWWLSPAILQELIS